MLWPCSSALSLIDRAWSSSLWRCGLGATRERSTALPWWCCCCENARWPVQLPMSTVIKKPTLKYMTMSMRKYERQSCSPYKIVSARLIREIMWLNWKMWWLLEYTDDELHLAKWAEASAETCLRGAIVGRSGWKSCRWFCVQWPSLDSKGEEGENGEVEEGKILCPAPWRLVSWQCAIASDRGMHLEPLSMLALLLRFGLRSPCLNWSVVPWATEVEEMGEETGIKGIVGAKPSMPTVSTSSSCCGSALCRVYQWRMCCQ